MTVIIFILVTLVLLQLFGPWLGLALIDASASTEFTPWSLWVFLLILLFQPIVITIYLSYNRHLLPRGSLRFFSAFYLAASVMAIVPMFALGYYAESHRDSSCLSESHISRPDAIYFTITTFTTTGYGDIHPNSTQCRMLATTQMALDLIIFAFVVSWAISRTADIPAEEDERFDVEAATFMVARPWWMPRGAVRSIVNRIEAVSNEQPEPDVSGDESAESDQTARDA